MGRKTIPMQAKLFESVAQTTYSVRTISSCQKNYKTDSHQQKSLKEESFKIDSNFIDTHKNNLQDLSIIGKFSKIDYYINKKKSVD